MTSSAVPAIPASCAQRPTIGGLVAPVLNLRLADGGVDFRSQHQQTFERCWKQCVCQICGSPIAHPAVLFGGPNQLRANHFDEPPMCASCAVYTSRACPMVAGLQLAYASRARLSEGRRGQRCTIPDCQCGGYVLAESTADSAGAPAHPWYALYISRNAYAVAVHEVITRCTDKGCEHTRLLVNGGKLTAPPLKIILVSSPDEGRVWRRAYDVDGGWPR